MLDEREMLEEHLLTKVEQALPGTMGVKSIQILLVARMESDNDS